MCFTTQKKRPRQSEGPEPDANGGALEAAGLTTDMRQNALKNTRQGVRRKKAGATCCRGPGRMREAGGPRTEDVRRLERVCPPHRGAVMVAPQTISCNLGRAQSGGPRCGR